MQYTEGIQVTYPNTNGGGGVTSLSQFMMITFGVKKLTTETCIVISMIAA